MNDWHGVPDVSEFMTSAEGEAPFTVDTYCEEALMDRRGSLQISRCGRLGAGVCFLELCPSGVFASPLFFWLKAELDVLWLYIPLRWW